MTTSISKSERRKLRRQQRKLNPRRLTIAGALELALCLAQYFYYELDVPIMTDTEYDDLEKRYIRLRKNNPCGVIENLLKSPGNANNIKNWLTAWRE